MAQPRFTGHGFTNPLNPLSLHAENRYREPMPVMGDFQRYEAETVVFEAVGGIVLKGIRLAAKATGKAVLVGLKKTGAKTAAVAKQVAKAIEKRVAKVGKEAAEASAEAGDDVAKQIRVTKMAQKGAALKGGTKVGGKELGKKAQAAVGKAWSKVTITGTAKTVGLGAVVYGGVRLFQGIDTGFDAVDNFFANLSGANCDEKIEERGIEEDSDEYADAITECQEQAEKKTMMFMGGAAIVLVGVIYFVFIR